MTTEEKIVEMLTTNTGQHFLDSGGAYGRNWERNQGRNFAAEPAATLEVLGHGNGDTEILVSLSTYHFLVERLEYDEEMDERFQRFLARPSREDTYWPQDVEDFVERLKQKGIWDVSDSFSVNTYNGEDLVDQTLQYYQVDTDNEVYIFLQVHGGCGVRGGYTRPTVFRGMDEWPLADNAEATIQAIRPEPSPDQQQLPATWPETGQPPYWRTDDGYHWYEEGSTAGKELQTYPTTEDPELRGTGYIYLDEEGGAYCPLTGWKLDAY
jgi:hypothetical protein